MKINVKFFFSSILFLTNPLVANAEDKKFPAEGFDSYLQTFQGNCIKQDLDKLYYSGQNTNDINYYFDLSAQQLAHKLESKGSGGVNFRIISGKTEISLSKEYSSNQNSLSFVYDSTITGKSAIVHKPILTDLGKSATYLIEPEKRKICGNQFISAINLGAKFLLNAKLFFKNEEAKSRFLVTVSMKFLWKTFTRTVVDENLRKFSNDVSIVVSATQIGGSQAKFQNFLTRIGGKPNCSFDNLRPCQEYLTSLIRYSQTDFIAQLNDMRYSLNPEEGLVPLSYIFSDYASFGFLNLASNSSLPLDYQANLTQKNVLNNIQNKIEDEYANNERASQFILNKDTFLLTNNQLQSIQELLEKSNFNLTKLIYAKETCLYNKYQCLEIQNITFSQLVNYDLATLNPQNPINKEFQ